MCSSTLFTNFIVKCKTQWWIKINGRKCETTWGTLKNLTGLAHISGPSLSWVGAAVPFPVVMLMGDYDYWPRQASLHFQSWASSLRAAVPLLPAHLCHLSQGWRCLDRQAFHQGLLSSPLCGDLISLTGYLTKDLFTLYNATKLPLVDTLLLLRHQRIRSRHCSHGLTTNAMHCGGTLDVWNVNSDICTICPTA